MRQWSGIYRNKVKLEISIRKKNVYADKTNKLPKNDCKRWWSIVNKLQERKTKKSNICLHRDGKILSDNDLVTTLNSYFTLVNADIPSLDLARAAFLDFCKPFDKINHNFVFQQLINIGVRKSIIPWNCNFLTIRLQAVKIVSTISQWLPITAGVPQATKLGPIIFLLMINDLNSSSPTTSNWKYVDDITISEVVPVNGNSVLQLELDNINSWTQLMT